MNAAIWKRQLKRLLASLLARPEPPTFEQLLRKSIRSIEAESESHTLLFPPSH
ncbi:MAG: hypothetical protein AAF430_03020 [Myxococcota bacterium]